MLEMVMSQEEIEEACASIGKRLTDRLGKSEGVPLFVGIMNGAINFLIHLIEYIPLSIELDYMQVSSYQGTSSSGKISLKRDLSASAKGRTVVIVEDIVDTGLTMDFLISHLKKCGAKEIIVVCLFNKTIARKIPVQIDYAGKVLTENKFIVGFGLDYRGLHRNIPYVFVPTTEDIESWDTLLLGEHS